jgi:hypothetical protein
LKGEEANVGGFASQVAVKKWFDWVITPEAISVAA